MLRQFTSCLCRSVSSTLRKAQMSSSKPIQANNASSSSLRSFVSFSRFYPLEAHSKCLPKSVSHCPLITSHQNVTKSSLLPVNSSFLISQIRTYKVRVVLKLRCSGCYFISRKGRRYVECRKKPRHKQMQKMARYNLYKDDYSKGDYKRAAHWHWNKRQRFYWLGDNEYSRMNWVELQKLSSHPTPPLPP